MFDLVPLIIGLLGSLHCLGMCGPLVFAYSFHLSHAESESSGGQGFSWARVSAHHVAFHSGRILTYVILGGLVAGLFQAADLSEFFSNFRNGLMLFGGALLILLGLVLLKIFPLPSFLANLAALPSGGYGHRLSSLLRSSSPVSKLLLGMAVGTMPCCLSWAMIITAATSQNPIEGSITMLYFGLGTVPALFLAGLSTSLLSRKTRFLGERAAALLVVVTGVVLLLRGVEILD
jgi:uncharacterized protein